MKDTNKDLIVRLSEMLYAEIYELEASIAKLRFISWFQSKSRCKHLLFLFPVRVVVSFAVSIGSLRLQRGHTFVASNKFELPLVYNLTRIGGLHSYFGLCRCCCFRTCVAHCCFGARCWVVLKLLCRCHGWCLCVFMQLLAAGYAIVGGWL